MRRAPDRGLSPQIGAAKRAVITELPLPQLLLQLPARNNASFGIYRKNPCGAINQAAAQMEQQEERGEEVGRMDDFVRPPMNSIRLI